MTGVRALISRLRLLYSFLGMPAISLQAKVLVSGASGFIGAHVVKALIDKSYHVVGTVRSSSKGEYLAKQFGNKFTYVIVEDIEKPGAFDEAVVGADAVLHTASPVSMEASDPQRLIRPAVQGTVGMLGSILKHGSTVKRVIITSSIVSVYEPKDGPSYTFTEKDWNNYSAEQVEKEGLNTPSIHGYRASKVLAERAAWKFAADNTANIKWDLATILPVLVFGPTVHEVSSVSSLNATVAMFHNATSTAKPREQLLSQGGNFVDVRDVAAAHVRALEVEKAGGERFITAAGPFTWQDFYDELNAANIPDIPKGFPGEQKGVVFPVIADGSKTTRVLGVQYRPQRETAVDTVRSIRERFSTV